MGVLLDLEVDGRGVDQGKLMVRSMRIGFRC